MAGLLNASTLGSIYQQYLGRTPDQAGSDYWMNSGVGVSEIESLIKNSQEAKDRAAGVTPTPSVPTPTSTTPATGTQPGGLLNSTIPTATQPQAPIINMPSTPVAPPQTSSPTTSGQQGGALSRADIGNLYSQYLGRPARADELDYWTPQSAAGVNVLGNILNSQEYTQRIGSQTPSATAPTALANTTAGAAAQADYLKSQVAEPVRAAAGQRLQPVSTEAPTPVTSTGYAPTGMNVAPEATSAYQLAKITGKGSELDQQSETFANQQSNRRGLLNSSMAVGAARDAVLRNAMPLAQQDASTYARAAEFTAGAKNAADQFAAQAMNTAALTNADNVLKTRLADLQANTTLTTAQKQLETQRAIADANNANNLEISKGDNATKNMLANLDIASKITMSQLDTNTKIALANLDVASKTNLARLGNDNQRLIQTNSAASSMYQQLSVAIANIQLSEKLTGQAKADAINTQIDYLKAGLATLTDVTKLDLGQYFPNVAYDSNAENAAAAADAAAASSLSDYSNYQYTG